MIKSNRAIVSLILRDGLVVKGEQFKNHRYVGEPTNILHIFNDLQVDEISLVDPFVTDLRDRASLEALELILSDSFLPTSYGGGIRSLETVDRLAERGIEKFIFKFADTMDTNLCRQIVQKYGKQALVLSLEIRGPKTCGFAPEALAQLPNLLEKNFGEIVVHNVFAEGLRNGPDFEFVESLPVDRFTVPLIYSGGIGNKRDLKEVLSKAYIDAASIGAAYVFNGPLAAVNLGYFRHGA